MLIKTRETDPDHKYFATQITQFLRIHRFGEIDSLMVFHKTGRGHYEYQIPEG